MSPKSLLRHRMSVSSLAELSDGRFQPVIGEQDALKAQDVRRVVLCSGKVYFELLEQRRKDERKDVAIIRLEQLNPFPQSALAAELARYKKPKEFIWCQEEPENQGAGRVIQPLLQGVLQTGEPLSYAGRPAYAAPAEGFLIRHQAAQAALVAEALGPHEQAHRCESARPAGIGGGCHPRQMAQAGRPGSAPRRKPGGPRNRQGDAGDRRAAGRSARRTQKIRRHGGEER